MATCKIYVQCISAKSNAPDGGFKFYVRKSPVLQRQGLMGQQCPPRTETDSIGVTCLLGENYRRMAMSDPTNRIEGMDVVSTRCKLSQGCQAIGCRRVKNQCIDAAEWQCATRKKQLDCIVAQDFSPIDMRADLDQMCGARYNQA